VNFDTAEIFFSGENRESCVFQIDYFRWFSDIASGISPGMNYDAKEQVRQLLARPRDQTAKAAEEEGDQSDSIC
jgi:hypothetical protein